MSGPERERLVITREPAQGDPRRVVYDPRDDGRWDFREERWNGCKWLAVGSTIVDRVAIARPEEMP